MLNDTLSYTKILEHPPTWLIAVPHELAKTAREWWIEFALSIEREIVSLIFRGVSVDRLASIYRFGTDVVPSDSVIFVGDFSKAWEYGGFPKIILGYDRKKLEHTYIEIDSDTPFDEVEELRKTYPNILTSIDGTKKWLSRLSEEDRRMGAAYEANYARWIPGSPWGALKAVLVFCGPQEWGDLANKIQESHQLAQQEISGNPTDA